MLHNVLSVRENFIRRSKVQEIEKKCEINRGVMRAAHELSLAREALQKAAKAGDRAPWGRAKLMIVGQGRAGKTSTVRRLLNQGFDPQEASTLGVKSEQQLSVDLSRTENGFVPVEPEEDFTRGHLTRAARFRYKNNGKAKHAASIGQQALEITLPTFHAEMVATTRLESAANEPVRSPTSEQRRGSVPRRNETVKKEKSNAKEKASATVSNIRENLVKPNAKLAGSAAANGSKSRKPRVKLPAFGRKSTVNESYKSSAKGGDTSGKVRSGSEVQTAVKKEEKVMNKELNKTLTLKRNKEAEERKMEPERNLLLAKQADEEEDDQEEVARRYSEKMLVEITEDEEETRVQLTIWDYGGQRVFYALHHLFLTEFGAYLLVFDMREVLTKEDVAVEYLQFWLKSIALHAPQSPIVLVGTYADEVHTRSEYGRINEVLEDRVNIVDEHNNQVVPNENNGLAFFPVDNRNNKGLREVQDAVLVALTGKDFMTYPVPLSWISCLERLLRSESRSADYMRLSEVEVIANDCGVQPQDVTLMLSFFHETGSLFYFHRCSDLRDIVILNPQWLVDALTCLIYDNEVHTTSVWEVRRSLRPDEKLFRTRGVLSPRLRKAKWKAKGLSTEVQEKLLILMENMLLVCKWPWHKGKGACIIPSILLSKKNLEARAELDVIEAIQKYDGAKCKIDFSESFLPEGLFQRLVCMCAVYAELFSDEVEDPPIVRGRAAIIVFGVEVVFGMECDTVGKVILVSVKPDSRPGAGPKLVKLLNSMLTGLRDDFMGRRLSWILKLNSSEDSSAFVEYEKLLKVRKSHEEDFIYKLDRYRMAHFDHWFGESTAPLGSLVEEDTAELVTFEKEAEQFGLLHALQQLIGRSKLRKLPEGLKHHCFISYKQRGGSEIAMTLFFLLLIAGYRPWYDQSREEINVQAMKNGVRESAVYVLVLSKDVFKSNAVLTEFREARKLRKPVILVYENDGTKEGYCGFDEYINSVPKDLKGVFDETEALKFERRFYLLLGTMQQVNRRMQKHF